MTIARLEEGPGTMVGAFEVNELLACALVLIATAVIVAARAHPANTPRTRAWWSRFLALAALVSVAQLATNVEQAFSEDSLGRTVINLIEHLALLSAAAWALKISVHALLETHRRLVGTGEVRGDGPACDAD